MSLSMNTKLTQTRRNEIRALRLEAEINRDFGLAAACTRALNGDAVALNNLEALLAWVTK